MINFRDPLIIGSLKMVDCAHHGERHRTAVVYSMSDLGPVAFGFICPDGDEPTPEAAAEATIENVWNAAADMKHVAVGGEWSSWWDLTDDGRRAARAVVNPLIRQVIEAIPPQP